MARDAGSVVIGRYRLVELLGEGGMGAVWRAHDERMRRDVALKQLKLPMSLEAGVREHLVARMEREARSIGMLKHPGIVTVYDQFHDDDGLPWIVMELVRGRSLAAVISDDGPLDEVEAARIGAQIAEALAAAHEAQIVHRDIKPANILLEGRRVVVGDFGLAAVPDETTLTASGALLGTPAYLAPEQVNDREATSATDVWALGATLYAAVEGRPAFTGTSLAALLLAISQGRPAPTRRARLLAPVLRDLLRHDPGQRPTAKGVAATLSALADSAPAAPPPDTTAPDLADPVLITPSPRTSRRAFIIGAGVAVLAVAAPIGYFPDRDAQSGRNHTPAASGRPSLGQSLTGHTGAVNAVAFSPDGRALASVSDDNTVRLWDPVTRRPLGQPLTGHTGAVLAVAFSPDGETLLTGSEDETARLWDVAARAPSGKPLTEHMDVVRSVAFSPDGKTLATGGADKVAFVWDADSRDLIGDPLINSNGVGSMSFSRDGETLAVGGSYPRLWDLSDRARFVHRPFKGDPRTFGAVAFSPDGEILASGSVSVGNRVRLWRAATRNPFGPVMTGHTGGVYSVAFSPDGKILATGSQDETVRLWDVAAGKPLGTPLTGHTGPVESVAFSPDGKTLASASRDHTVRLWDVAAASRREPS